MDLKSSVIVFLRAINVLTNKIEANNSKSAALKQKQLLMKKLKYFTDEEKQTFIAVLKSMGLMTGGRVDWIRKPSQFNDTYNKTWDTILFPTVTEIIKELDPNFQVFTQSPTKKDYELAHILLPKLGSHTMSPEDIKQGSQKLGKNSPDVDSMEVPTTLYRGLTALDTNSILGLTAPGKTWNIEDAVSTSMDKDQSLDFAGVGDVNNPLSLTGDGPSVFFTINNPKRQGFIADKFSRFQFEAEVILSGILKVKSWTITMTGNAFLKGDDGQYAKYTAKPTLILNGDTKEMTIHFMGKPDFKINLGDGLPTMLQRLFSETYTEVPYGKGVIYIVVRKKSVLMRAVADLE